MLNQLLVCHISLFQFEVLVTNTSPTSVITPHRKGGKLKCAGSRQATKLPRKTKVKVMDRNGAGWMEITSPKAKKKEFLKKEQLRKATCKFNSSPFKIKWETISAYWIIKSKTYEGAHWRVNCVRDVFETWQNSSLVSHVNVHLD